jgi:hypothetical protein
MYAAVGTYLDPWHLALHTCAAIIRAACAAFAVGYFARRAATALARSRRGAARPAP